MSLQNGRMIAHYRSADGFCVL